MKEDGSEEKAEEAGLPVVPYMAMETEEGTGSVMPMIRFVLGYIMFSVTTGVAMAWWESAGWSALSSIVWVVPVVALGFFVWLARRGRKAYLIGFLVSVWTCGSGIGLCSLYGR